MACYLCRSVRSFTRTGLVCDRDKRLTRLRNEYSNELDMYVCLVVIFICFTFGCRGIVLGRDRVKGLSYEVDGGNRSQMLATLEL